MADSTTESLLARPGFAIIAHALIETLGHDPATGMTFPEYCTHGRPSTMDELLHRASLSRPLSVDHTRINSWLVLQELIGCAEAFHCEPDRTSQAGRGHATSQGYTNYQHQVHQTPVSERPESNHHNGSNYHYDSTYGVPPSPGMATPRTYYVPPAFNEPRQDPAFGLLPHLYQTGTRMQPMLRWPMSANASGNSPVPSRRPSAADQRVNQARAPVTANSSRGDEHVITKALYDTFKQQRSPKKFFRIGRVFMILWTEPLGDERLSESSQFTFKGLYNDWLHQKVRRFIVIGEAERHCLAIPIMSYGNKGVSKQGVNKADHGIVYIGARPPEPDVDELPTRNELPMVEVPIRVDPDTPTEKLAAKSRIHYSKVYTIEHNVKARSVGMIHSRSVPDLLIQTKFVWTRTPNGLGALGIMPGRRTAIENDSESASIESTERNLPEYRPQIESQEVTLHMRQLEVTDRAVSQ
ncbi:hypothetical protein AC578_7514 [Pseudocercospora eumusae]|uniref:DUF6590 domain-containing protein n=1 Tax=Pseudocercospora eumusae TaxID=321146 RepID=A0A139GWK6_9PEZI|nr:hypothetical protein AC578_7514 [Pseudocercospora eumusae]